MPIIVEELHKLYVRVTCPGGEELPCELHADHRVILRVKEEDGHLEVGHEVVRGETELGSRSEQPVE